MPESVYVSDYNPITFLLAVQDKIRDGFYADETVDGYPYFSSPNEVRLTKSEQPEQRNDLSKVNTVVIESFHPALFVLDVQDAILQGFEIDPDSLVISTLNAQHLVTLKRVQTEVKDEAPKEAVVLDLKPVEADPVGEPDPEVQSVSEALTEAAEAPKKKGGRPPKVKPTV